MARSGGWPGRGCGTLPQNYRKDHEMSLLTKEVPAPKIIKMVPPNELLDIAQMKLNEIKGSDSLQERIPQDENYCLLTEADLGELSRLSLIHSVNIALKVALKVELSRNKKRVGLNVAERSMCLKNLGQIYHGSILMAITTTKKPKLQSSSISIYIFCTRNTSSRLVRHRNQKR